MSELDRAKADFDEYIDRLAAALGTLPEEVVRTLTTLRDYRCWKRIPRCFNGWGVGLCARTNGHDGDCNPMPEIERKGRA
jgi:hypothetical protein